MAGEPQADCLFCKIVAGEVPSEVVRESEHAVAFRDINPQAPSHVLVIPKAHYPNVGALAAARPELAGEVLRLAGEVAAQESPGADEPSYRVVFNTGATAGQTVFHVHAHVLSGRGFQWPPG